MGSCYMGVRLGSGRVSRGQLAPGRLSSSPHQQDAKKSLLYLFCFASRDGRFSLRFFIKILQFNCTVRVVEMWLRTRDCNISSTVCSLFSQHFAKKTLQRRISIILSCNVSKSKKEHCNEIEHAIYQVMTGFTP